MDQQRWQKIDKILQAALDREPHERAAFLAETCTGDGELQREVESLLAHEDSAEYFIETSAIKVVARGLAEDDLSGQQIGHYRILNPIGAGGMGKVYLAEDEKLKRRVAIKFLPETFTADPERVRRFEQEARAASALNHPNIITIHEVGQTGAPEGKNFIVTEFIEGRTLRELMRDTRLGVKQTIEIAAQVASAMKAAHTAFIVHRDIKPENLMLREDGLVKVLDFGIAKLGEEHGVPPSGGSGGFSRPARLVNEPLQPEGGTPCLTSPGMILGTASYMSPEQARGESLDGRTDLFSLGVVLYEMATGNRLFASATRADLLQTLLGQQELLPSSAKLDGVPKELESIIRKALRRQREERYATADEMLADLKKLQHQFDSRANRRMVRLSALVAVLAVLAVFIAALASVNEVWEERILRDGHTKQVRQIALSPDGQTLVSVGDDALILVWDLARRARRATLQEHSEPVSAVTFAPDGKRFVTASYDGTAIVWDTARLEKLVVLPCQRAAVYGLSFTPDGQWLILPARAPSRASDWPPLNVWRVSDWQKVAEFVVAAAFVLSPDSRLLMLRDWNRSELPTGKDLGGATEGWGKGTLLADGTRLAAIDNNGFLSLWDVSRFWRKGERTLLKRMPAHEDRGRAVAYSPDGRMIATGGEDIVVWDARTLAKLARFTHKDRTTSLVFTKDSRRLISAHGDGAILIWDIAEQEALANLAEHCEPVRAAAFAPDGSHLATGSEDHSVLIWDAALGIKQAVLLGHGSRVAAIAYSPDGKWLASAEQQGAVHLWDVAKGTRLRTFLPERRTAAEFGYCVAFSPDQRYLVTSFGVHSIADGRMVVRFAPELDPVKYQEVYGAAFSRDGRWLAGVTPNLKLRVWNVTTWQARQSPSDGGQMTSVSFSPDSKWLVTGEDQGFVRLWEVASLREVAVLGRHAGYARSLTFSPDGQFVASAGDDKQIALWDVGWRRRYLPGFLARWLARDARIGTHTAPVLAIAFSPDGKQLVSGEHDKSVRLYTRRRTLWGWQIE